MNKSNTKTRPIKIEINGQKMDLSYNTDDWRLAKSLLISLVNDLGETSFEDLTIHLITEKKSQKLGSIES